MRVRSLRCGAKWGSHMTFITKSLTGALLIAAVTTLSAAASAGVGDLLVAPTRIVLDGRRGAEVILNNIGDDTATYRVSVEFRRMTPEGQLEDVTEPTAADRLAEEMIVYAPRRVALAPGPRRGSRTANIACTCWSVPSRRPGRSQRPVAKRPRASVSR